jgi:tRNA (mo5U34)-methyltransferase
MTAYQGLIPALEQLGAAQWAKALPARLQQIFAGETHGDFQRWQAVVHALPQLSPGSVDLLDAVRIGDNDQLEEALRLDLQERLQLLHPWRKGPYNLYGVEIDTEWRSDWKWERLQHEIAPLHNRAVLDVGCGNGYHCWRMLGAGARLVIGIDPTLLSVMQFQAVKKLYAQQVEVYVLPLGIEDVPPELKLFDTVFSMGVLYHRRSPLDHLLELKACLRPGGELILETLVVAGGVDTVLMPAQRYAQMRNVWFLPSCDVLQLWLSRCGFKNIRLVNVAKTTVEEQRSTEWMRFHSLRDFLDPNDADLTCEGLPAPVRAVFIANAD